MTIFIAWQTGLRQTKWENKEFSKVVYHYPSLWFGFCLNTVREEKYPFIRFFSFFFVINLITQHWWKTDRINTNVKWLHLSYSIKISNYCSFLWVKELTNFNCGKQVFLSIQWTKNLPSNKNNMVSVFHREV